MAENKEYPLSAGEVLRDSTDWWMGGELNVTTQMLKNHRMLLEGESGFSGMVGEHISCYSYAVVDWKGGAPRIIPIKSEEDFRREVYPFQFKRKRIASWAAMKNGQLFGWSEDPRPYIE